VAGLSTGCPQDFEAAGHPVAKVKSFTQYFDMATLLKQIGAFKS